MCDAGSGAPPPPPSESAPSGGLPTEPAVPVAAPVEISRIRTSAPLSEEKKKVPHNDDNWNNDNWEPMPWMPWKPIKPIKVPDDAEKCQKHCDHPCGWSQSNGKSLCCETKPGKSCSMTQVNGDCYCA